MRSRSLFDEDVLAPGQAERLEELKALLEEPEKEYTMINATTVREILWAEYEELVNHVRDRLSDDDAVDEEYVGMVDDARSAYDRGEFQRAYEFVTKARERRERLL